MCIYSNTVLFVWIFTILTVDLNNVRSELFTSTTHLTQLLKTEIELSKQLETFLEHEFQRLNQLEKYVCTICFFKAAVYPLLILV